MDGHYDFCLTIVAHDCMICVKYLSMKLNTVPAVDCICMGKIDRNRIDE